MKTIKIHRMQLSRVFPARHPRAGEETYFYPAIYNALEFQYKGYISSIEEGMPFDKKMHTLRAVNPESKSKTWFEKIKEVREGKAVLVVYQWDGRPYSADGNTNLFVFGTGAVKDFIDELMKSEKYGHAIPVIDSGIGVQMLKFDSDRDGCTFRKRFKIDYSDVDDIRTLAANDGLSFDDFKAWFKGYDLSKPMAIIHFTEFRY
jgi:hypothetical protein